MPELNQNSSLAPQDISCVAEASNATTVNNYLSLGWVIMGTSSSQYSEHGYSFKYHLAWPKNLGEVKHPAKTGLLEDDGQSDENPEQDLF